LLHSPQNRVPQLLGLIAGEIHQYAPRDALQIVASPFPAHDSFLRMAGAEKDVRHFVCYYIPQNSVLPISLNGQLINSAIEDAQLACGFSFRAFLGGA
jgi:hypothetical protein